jgi:hypothetical protein
MSNAVQCASKESFLTTSADSAFSSADLLDILFAESQFEIFPKVQSEASITIFYPPPHVTTPSSFNLDFGVFFPPSFLLTLNERFPELCIQLDEQTPPSCAELLDREAIKVNSDRIINLLRQNHAQKANDFSYVDEINESGIIKPFKLNFLDLTEGPHVIRLSMLENGHTYAVAVTRFNVRAE